MKYEELLALKSLKGINPSDQVHVIGNLFDLSFDHNNLEGIENAFTLSEQIDIQTLDDESYTLFNYDLSNGWSYVRKLKYRQTANDWSFQMKELHNEIFFLRKAIGTVGFGKIPKERQCQIYTNLGNSFSFTGRFVEAQEYWTKALNIIPHFPMALGNKGNGLFHYGLVLFDDVHKAIFITYAHHYLKNSLDLREYLEGNAEQGFQGLMEFIEARVSEDSLSLPDLNTYDLGDIQELSDYRTWCLQNKLYINPLNDLGYFTVACHDCLNLPTMVIPAKRPPIYLNLFNQIKQEFSTARYSLYESFQANDIHLSDIDVPLVETMESVRYSFYVEQVKIAFRLSYSILDKIAYLLNDYLDLQIEQSKVSFRSMWYSNYRKAILHTYFTASDNWALRGLFWLSKDLYEKENDFDSVLEPEAKEIATIRNFIEHKGFKVLPDIRFFDPEFENEISYSISRNDFERKTMNLLKLTRAAIMYTAIAISHEESKKDVSGIKAFTIGSSLIPPYMRV